MALEAAAARSFDSHLHDPSSATVEVLANTQSRVEVHAIKEALAANRQRRAELAGVAVVDLQGQLRGLAHLQSRSERLRLRRER